MAKIVFKNGTVRIVSFRQLQFILGIKNIKEVVKTYIPLTNNTINQYVNK